MYGVFKLQKKRQEEECEDLELEEDEKQVLWESEYKGEAGYLEDKIKELEEELEDY